ncbi:PspC domain-containing protein [Ornithinimicrobium cryptoxanthini]|uniref:PspC domain-containing protein n=1 Tax=Ornithinimicrobium cryptoxanthini TaxID=2934161 RepID=A0ABY4YH04_9MICO|nr:PspC domain-containing protein [Ornithinimicrobium cryptoxanthini]USQ75944.1 PspC domain-containing protein [Ornithinimicrobium cryptoxanthini]
MTQTPPHGGKYGGHPGSQGADNFFAGLRRVDLRRSDDNWIAGVCSGLAERLGVDALVIRALFVLLSLGMGVGVLIYLVAWLLIPNQQEETHIEAGLRDGRAESIVLLVVAVLAMFGSFGWFGGGWLWDRGGTFGWGLVSLVILGLGAWWLWSEWSKREQPGFYGQRFAMETQSQHPAPPFAGATQAPGDSAGAGEAASAGDGFAGTPAAATSGGATAWAGHGGVAPLGSPSEGGTWHRREQAPKPPPAPRRPSRRSAGVAGTLLGMGLALTAGGGLAWAAAEYSWSVNPVVIGLVGALGALGLVVLILGLVGRTSGFPGFLAVVALLATAGALPIGEQFVVSGRVGDATWNLGPSSDDPGPYRVGAGTGTLDLRRVSAEEFTEPIEASVSFGNLTILVPEDVTVRIEAGVGMGSVVPGDGRPEFGGINVNEAIVVGDGPVELEVEARVGFGQILVEGDGR